MEDNPYEDDDPDSAQPPPQPNSGLAEVKQEVQRMLGQQLDPTVTREKQAAKSRSFAPAALTYRPFVEQARGQLSLADFRTLEQDHQGLEEMQACGLTDQEIALKLEEEGRQLSCFVPPTKRGRFAADPTVRQRRLEVLEEKLRHKKASSIPPPSCEGTSASSGQSKSNEAAESKGKDISVSGKFLSALDKKYIHPDDPINHLDAIAARLFGEKTADKQRGDASPPSEQRAASPTGQPAGGLSPGCHGDGSCHADRHDRRRESPDLEGRGSGAGIESGSGTVHSTDCQEGGANPDGNQPSNLHHLREGPAARTEISNFPAAKGSGGGGQTAPSVSEECSKESCPRRLADRIRPLTHQELLERRLSPDDIRKMERFRDYSPGQPSQVLYLKNLSSKVTEAELASLFVCFQHPDKPQIIFKLLTGRMRGQAFVTFPDAETAAEAMQHVNGYPLRGRPVILQYGKPR